MSRYLLFFALAISVVAAACKPDAPADAAPTEATVATASPGQGGARCGDRIAVEVFVAGASPAEVEAEVVVQWAEAVAAIDGVARVEALAGEGLARLVVHPAPIEREAGEPARPRAGVERAALRRLRDAVRRAVTAPEIAAVGAETPLVRVLPGHEHLVVVTAGGLEPDALAAWAEAAMRRVERVPAARVDPVAVPRPEVRVAVDPARLVAVGLSAGDVADAMRRAIGDGAPDSLVALGQVRVGATGGQPVRLADVATLERAFGVRPQARRAGAAVAVLGVRAPSEARSAVDSALRQDAPDGLELEVSAPVTIDSCDSGLAPRVAGPLSLVRVHGDADADAIATALGAEATVVDGASLLHGQAGLSAVEVVATAEDEAGAAARTARWQRELAVLPGARGETLGPAAASVRLVLTHADRHTLGAALATVRTTAARAPVAVATAHDGEPTVDVALDSHAAARLGVTAADVARAVRLATEAVPLGEVRLAGRRLPVVLGAPAEPSVDDLHQVLVATPTGQRVPLAQLVRITLATAPAPRYRIDGQPAAIVRLSAVGVGADALRPWVDATLRPALADVADLQVQALD